jgi:hypothetical protein
MYLGMSGQVGEMVAGWDFRKVMSWMFGGVWKAWARGLAVGVRSMVWGGFLGLMFVGLGWVLMGSLANYSGEGNWDLGWGPE